MSTGALEVKRVFSPLYEELAEWFRKSDRVRDPHEIGEEIKRLRLERKTFDPAQGVPYSEYSRLIKEVRAHLETRYSVTLVNIRGRGKTIGGYKLANEQEATLYGVKQFKRFILHGERVRRLVPLMKKQYILPAVKRVFGETRQEAERFVQLGQKFLIAYDKDVKDTEDKEQSNGGTK